jgi:hypothetical protein
VVAFVGNPRPRSCRRPVASRSALTGVFLHFPSPKRNRLAGSPENVSTWLVGGTLVTVMDNTMPPRDPNDDDDEDEDEEDDEDEDRREEPPVVREPDE